MLPRYGALYSKCGGVICTPNCPKDEGRGTEYSPVELVFNKNPEHIKYSKWEMENSLGAEINGGAF